MNALQTRGHQLRAFAKVLETQRERRAGVRRQQNARRKKIPNGVGFTRRARDRAGPCIAIDQMLQESARQRFYVPAERIENWNVFYLPLENINASNPSSGIYR